MTNQPTSPGLWALAWRRLRADRVAMVSLAVVAAFLAMLVLSSSGLIVADWEQEVGVNYAPPAFAGAAGGLAQKSPAAADAAVPANAFDPLAADIAAIRAHTGQGTPSALDMYGVVDPLAADIAALRAGRPGAAATAQAARRETLPFGADKWG
ncbi:MAG: binding--dependent transport system inner rane component family protein, partial [Massilia sp.]|nr:binding--dependent transport system inner rane component family protein [Massilia sp.]